MKPIGKVKSKLLEDGFGWVQVDFERPLEIAPSIDLLRATAKKLLTKPTLFLTVEGTPLSHLRDFEHCREIFLKPPKGFPVPEISIGLEDAEDLVSIDVSRGWAGAGTDEPSRYASGFLEVLSQPFEAWQGLMGIRPSR